MNVDDTGYGDYGFNDPNVRDTPFLDGLRARAHGVLGPARRCVGVHAVARVPDERPPRAAHRRDGQLHAVLSRGGLPRARPPSQSCSSPPATRPTWLASALARPPLRARAPRRSHVCAHRWHLGHRPEFLPPARGFDRFFGLGMSHDYGCTDHPGPSTNCARWPTQTCAASAPGRRSRVRDLAAQPVGLVGAAVR